jgi:hypothetical protein
MNFDKYNFKKYSLNILETINNTGFYEYKVFFNKQGESNFSFFVFNISKNTYSVNKYSYFKNKVKHSFNNFNDIFNFFNSSDNRINFKEVELFSLMEELSTLLKVIKDDKAKNRIIKLWKLQDNDYILSLFNSNNDFFIENFLPLFWEYIDETQRKYFFKKALKKKITISFNLLFNVKDSYFDEEIMWEDIYSIDTEAYYLHTLLFLKYNKIGNLNFAKIFAFLKESDIPSSSKTELFKTILKHEKIEASYKDKLIAALKLKDIDFINLQVNKALVENYICTKEIKEEDTKLLKL